MERAPQTTTHTIEILDRKFFFFLKLLRCLLRAARSSPSPSLLWLTSTPEIIPLEWTRRLHSIQARHSHVISNARNKSSVFHIGTLPRLITDFVLKHGKYSSHLWITTLNLAPLLLLPLLLKPPAFFAQPSSRTGTTWPKWVAAAAAASRIRAAAALSSVQQQQQQSSRERA